MRWPELPLLLVIALSLALAGCNSSPPRKDVDADARDAAAVQVKLGRGYMEAGDLETALDRLQRAVQIDPRSVDAHTLLGVLHEQINRPTQAETFYRKAQRLAPDNGEVNNNLGVFLCAHGQYGDADLHFRKALDDPFYRSPVVALGNAGACALKADQPASAENYFRQVLTLDKEHPIALFELARLRLREGDGLRARAFLQRLESSVSSDPVVLELGYQIETRLGDAGAAARYAERLRDEFPDYAPGPPPNETDSP